MSNDAELYEEYETSWLQENANQLIHYKDKIGVCNVICFCQCNKHKSIAILLVKPRQKQSVSCAFPMFVLPGGKRDLKAFQQSEPCWEAVSREFQEEVDDNLNYFCKKKCRFFDETVQVNLDTNMILDKQLKSNLKQGITRNVQLECNRQIPQNITKQVNIIDNDITAPNTINQNTLDKDPHIDVKAQFSKTSDILSINKESISINTNTEDEQTRFIQVTRRIRSYYIEINCQELPDIQFGRFHLFEVTERKWFDLEVIIDQFKGQYQLDKKQMIISPKIFRSMSIFGGKLVNIQQKQLQKLKYIYQPDICKITINQDKQDQDKQNQEQTNMNPFLCKQIDKINKTHVLFTRINFGIKQQPIIQQMGNSVAFI